MPRSAPGTAPAPADRCATRLDALGREQAGNGQIPKYVDPDGQDADFWYLGCIDATLWWLIGVDHARRFGTAEPTRWQPQVEHAIQWLLAQEHRHFRLLQQNGASDWAYIMPRSGSVLYTSPARRCAPGSSWRNWRASTLRTIGVSPSGSTAERWPPWAWPARAGTPPPSCSRTGWRVAGAVGNAQHASNAKHQAVPWVSGRPGTRPGSGTADRTRTPPRHVG